jgi:hypothetical protein
MKKAKGKKATVVRLNEKLLIISGTKGPMMFVKKDITKNVRKINPSIRWLLFIVFYKV